MKAITFSGKRIRTELLWLAGGFILALVFNTYVTIRHQHSRTDFFTSLPDMIILALVFYVLLLFFRGLFTLIIRLSARKGKN